VRSDIFRQVGFVSIHRRKAVAVSLFSLFALGGIATDELAAQTIPAAGSAPVFRVGDSVRLDVWGNDLYDGEFEIGEDGTVIHPLYRAIVLSGLSVPQAEAEFRRVLLNHFADPQFIVSPLFKVTISGQVGAPNIYTLPSHATLIQALTAAGGPTVDANLQRVSLLRDGTETMLDLRHPDNDFARIRIRSGDQIIVGERTSLWSDHIEPTIRTVGSMASIVYLVVRLATNSR